MKKFLCALLALGMALGMTFMAACGGGGGDNGGQTNSSDSLGVSSSIESEGSEDESSEEESSVEEGSEDSSEEEFVPDYTSTSDMVEYFSGSTGSVTYRTGKNLTIESLSKDEPIYIGEYDESNVFTVDGGEGFNRTLTVLGSGGGVVQADGGVLVLRNLTIKNETNAFGDNGYRQYYAEFGGKVRFENCTIDCSIQLRDNADAEFINCEINSIASDMYSVWVADGSVRFEGCTFTGYRALKVCEEPQFSLDIVNVTVVNCLFENLAKKPAIAIDIQGELSSTTVTFEGCEIYNCAPWTRDSLEGVDGFYESDTNTKTFNFTARDCYLDGSLFDFIDGQMIFAI